MDLAVVAVPAGMDQTAVAVAAGTDPTTVVVAAGTGPTAVVAAAGTGLTAVVAAAGTDQMAVAAAAGVDPAVEMVSDLAEVAATGMGLPELPKAVIVSPLSEHCSTAELLGSPQSLPMLQQLVKWK